MAAPPATPRLAAPSGARLRVQGGHSLDIVKQVPGRKTDVKDAQWIAELIRCGLVPKSFVPPKWQRALRDLTRYRRKPVEAQSSERNRLQRLFETCNVKLASVATDVFGKSGREMLRALIKGDEP